MTKLVARVTRMEQQRPLGCATCRHWGPAIYEDDDGQGGRPEQCPDCGRVVPIRLVRRYVGIRFDDI